VNEGADVVVEDRVDVVNVENAMLNWFVAN
jgi:hypothetical protein